MMNNHLTHLEDLIILEKERGLEKIIRVLLSFMKNETENITIKFDGSPSIFFGTDIRDNKKFVATKSIFNKTPIIFKSHDDIDKYIKKDDLKRKLKISYDLLPKVQGVVQSDLLFDKSSIIFGEDSYSFIPNIIFYSYNRKSNIGKQISTQYDIGIVPHTFYDIDENLNLTMKNEFTVKYPLNVYCQNRKIVLIEPKTNSHKFLKKLYDAIEKWDSNESFTTADMNKPFRNGYKFDPELSSTHNLYYNIMEIKNKLIRKFDNHMYDGLFLSRFLIEEKNQNKIEVGHEGYVYKNDSIFVKLVNREIFSRANFSSNFYRGWQYINN